MIRLTLRKEFVDHRRDARSVIGSLVLPVLGPVLLACLFQLLSDLSSGERPLELPVVGAEHAPRLVRYLETSGTRILSPPLSPEDSVRRGNADAVLIIDPSYGERYLAGESAPVRLIVDESRNDAQHNVHRVERLLSGYAQTIGALRLLSRGISPEVAMPIDVEPIDLATPHRAVSKW